MRMGPNRFRKYFFNYKKGFLYNSTLQFENSVEIGYLLEKQKAINVSFKSNRTLENINNHGKNQ